ncbi:Putative electron transport protein YccM [Fundidesulfovibrio magnetotacticus]|uniref:Electron transport protein YccM n=2 Tax=Fundidesulfovibrio magnetotacticus TaxID=2730080 RepID=A0A6V8LX48_9BACT|nr:Putative electron transport protein YccM [Fundidesulfovibrio magnetotacticus]
MVIVRRICQGFFLALFLWFCVAATVGAQWWQLRGWPIDWFLAADPLTALTTILSTGRLAPGLYWAVATVVLTAFLGRFFCGFVCPMGTLNQITGWAGGQGRTRQERVAANARHRLQGFKHVALVFFLACAALGSVQAGLLDPLPLLHRSMNLAVLPLADARTLALSDEPRLYDSAWLLGGVLLAILGLNLLRPRFFCRFLCPLGALFALLSRFTPWRIAKREAGKCGDCRLCEERCEGACGPSGEIVHGECVLCLNCLEACPSGRMGFAPEPSASGERHLPAISRRGVLTAAAAGAVAAPLWGVGALAGPARDASLLRPPGALDEERFLARCIRCGQCMRVCPSNIVQPALLQAGVQGLWTPALNFRMGRSGCQPNCIACGNACPTAAVRPLTLDEKHGTGDFADKGPVRLGTAFVDRTRCLPWAMDRPCIVCQEVCPVSPKAIHTRVVFEPVRDGRLPAARLAGDVLDLSAAPPQGLNLAGGDHAVRPAARPEAQPRRILGQSGGRLTLEKPGRGPGAWQELAPGERVEIVVRLQRPHVDPSRCIGCGMCEHDCPVSGLRAIRVTSENESRSRAGKMTV